jgi:hypothetical protein
VGFPTGRHGQDLATAYEQHRESDRILDGHRRTVTQFYSILTSRHELGVISPVLIYRHWTKKDLRILPEIVIPIERRLLQLIADPGDDTFTSLDPTLERLQRLYDEAPNV